jgi:hypothetical protein
MSGSRKVTGPLWDGKKLTTDSPWCAHALGKQQWKEKGNYFTKEQLRALDRVDGISIHPVSPIVERL